MSVTVVPPAVGPLCGEMPVTAVGAAAGTGPGSLLPLQDARERERGNQEECGLRARKGRFDTRGRSK